jgi:hypothetical protein
MSDELNKDEEASAVDAGQIQNEEMPTQELDKVAAGSNTTKQNTPILFADKER